MDRKAIEDVWKEYEKTHRPELKDQLIEHYVHLVKLVAGRLSIYLNQYIDTDDLVGYGTLGLIDAIDKFDLTKNVKFETYASLRIRGSILDAIRKLDWIPRTLRKKQKDMDKAYLEMESQLGRQPEPEEMAKYLNVSLKDYYEMLQEVNISSLVSIDDTTYHLDTIRDNSATLPENHAVETEMRDILAKAIDELPDREKKVICLYYYEELTLKEISKVLEVSESRISQIHTKAVSKLRVAMTKCHFVFPL